MKSLQKMVLLAIDEASIANELNKYFVNMLEKICKGNKADVEFDNTKLTNFICSRLNASSKGGHYGLDQSESRI